jgi:hypothetical protein
MRARQGLGGLLLLTCFETLSSTDPLLRPIDDQALRAPYRHYLIFGSCFPPKTPA